MWEKTYERLSKTQQDAPFANDGNSDSLEPYPTIDDDENNDSPELYPTTDDNEDYDADPNVAPSNSIETPTVHTSQQSKPWENATIQDHLIIIINDDENIDEVKRSLRKDFSRQGLKWTDEEEELRPWHFGLISIRLNFNKPRTIDIQMLSLSSPIPLWLKLKTEKQKNILKNDTPKKFIRRDFKSDFEISLRYGAFTDLNKFYYSPQHSWKNTEGSTKNEDPKWSVFLDDHRNGGGHIEWVIENSEMRRKKQLLVININQSIIVDICENGFDIYICQKCNMNEFEANATSKDNNRNDAHKIDSEKHKSNRSRSTSRDFEQRPAQPRQNSRPRRAQLLCPQENKYQQRRQIFYEHGHRIGVHAGCYFPTVQFSLRIDQFRLTNKNTRYVQNQQKKLLSLFIEFFLAHKITVCYGKINSDVGPRPYLFFQPKLPHFPSLIMKYSWQMLSSVGYRLQLQIDQANFLQELYKLSQERNNPDELFYRVCVYLSRIFSLKPFINISQELKHAITESRRKQTESSYGLIRKIDVQGDNDAYIPSVTLTPTTIRIKPLKLCRTNRVLRAIEQFGKALEHFILVDVRDENSRDLQSFHFRDLRSLLLNYLKIGFTLMDDDREYKYLHHSQSQLRERQFWFYHHNRDGSNLSFSEAYLWMGNFDKEKNPAKYAARMALCFSTTKAAVRVRVLNYFPCNSLKIYIFVSQVPAKRVLVGNDIKITVKDRDLLFTDGCGTMSIKLRNKVRHIQYNILDRNTLDFTALRNFNLIGILQ